MYLPRRITRSLGATLLFAMPLCLSPSAQAVTLATSSVSVNSHTALSLPNSSLSNTTGAALELSAAGTNNLAFNNGQGGFVAKPVTDDVFARASLATGELKTRAALAFGTDLSGTINEGVRNGSATATASFGDSFSTFLGSSPYIWSSGDTATFSFNITGEVNINGTIPAPTENPFGFPAPNPPQPLNMVYTQLTLTIYESGGLDVRNQLLNFDFATGDINDFFALNQQLEGMTIARDFWVLGDPIAWFEIDPAKIIPVLPDTPTALSFEFMPQGDFDWVLLMDTTVFLDASLQNVSVMVDFSNTIETSYDGPPGTTTFSISGFPGTQPLQQRTPGVAPEPATTLLFMLSSSVLLLSGLRRRRV
jgi:hypothetical protein